MRETVLNWMRTYLNNPSILFIANACIFIVVVATDDDIFPFFSHNKGLLNLLSI